MGFVLVEPFDACLARLLLHFAFECRVEVILYVVIGASIQKLSYLRPLVAVLHVQLQYFIVFLFTPSIFLDVWIQVVMPTLTALLSNPTLQIICYLTPVLGAVKSNLLNKESVFLLRPGTFNHLRV